MSRSVQPDATSLHKLSYAREFERIQKFDLRIGFGIFGRMSSNYLDPVPSFNEQLQCGRILSSASKCCGNIRVSLLGAHLFHKLFTFWRNSKELEETSIDWRFGYRFLSPAVNRTNRHKRSEHIILDLLKLESIHNFARECRAIPNRRSSQSTQKHVIKLWFLLKSKLLRIWKQKWQNQLWGLLTSHRRKLAKLIGRQYKLDGFNVSHCRRGESNIQYPFE